MSRVVLNQLDTPISIAGVRLTHFIGFFAALFPGIFVFDSFFIALGGVVALFLIKRIFGKFPPFFLLRCFYKAVPTRVFGKNGATLLESHVEKWVK